VHAAGVHCCIQVLLLLPDACKAKGFLLSISVALSTRTTSPCIALSSMRSQQRICNPTLLPMYNTTDLQADALLQQIAVHQLAPFTRLSMLARSDSVTSSSTSPCCALGINTMPIWLTTGLLLLLLLLLPWLLLLLLLSAALLLLLLLLLQLACMCSTALLSMMLPCLSKHARSPSITRPDFSRTCAADKQQ
jgi:hypothetical protein